MINKVDPVALKPVVSTLGTVAKNGAKFLGVVLPAALAADIFISGTTQKVEKERCSYCSDYCMEVTG